MIAVCLTTFNILPEARQTHASKEHLVAPNKAPFFFFVEQDKHTTLRHVLLDRVSRLACGSGELGGDRQHVFL